jgi:hypothetical protein
MWGIFNVQSQFWKSKNNLIFLKTIFFLKNKLGGQQLLSTFSILVIFEKLYLVKMCPIFDSAPLLLFTRYQNFL